MEKLGLEMEMVVAHGDTGRSHLVCRYFEALADIKKRRGIQARVAYIGARPIAVLSDGVESGLDNAFNHLESALGPFAGGRGGLDRLEAAVVAELSDVLDALKADDAVLLNASEHPDCPLDETFYHAARAPKPIYDYWVKHRGWRHHVGIDAKAQNGPTTSVKVENAARALNVMLGLAPAFIALFANSPLESGRLAGRKENRLTIWDRMFGPGKFGADLESCRTPDAPFNDLGAYFRRAYGGGTVMHTVPLVDNQDYKGDPRTVRVHGDPCLLGFLAGGTAQGTLAGSGRHVAIEPSAGHFEHMQFAPFLDARFRFRFGSRPSIEVLQSALQTPEGIEAMMVRHDVDAYIEGRVPGAGFPDAALLKEMNGAATAASVVMGPSALQQGLLNNLDEAFGLMQEWGWQRLRGLREAAVIHALEDGAVRQLVGEVIAVAQAGLDAAEHRHLDYVRWVWSNRRTGADRMLESWARLAGSPAERLRALAAQRTAVHPRDWEAPAAAVQGEAMSTLS